MINRRASHQGLTKEIRDHGSQANENRQVARRLRQLLPTRLKEIQDSFSHQKSAARKFRGALTATEYRTHLDELIEISYLARKQRVLYETKMMLIDARRSLRAFQVRDSALN